MATNKNAGFPIPKTVANWIPVAIPPTVEGRYLVWIRQGGSILKGRIGTFWYYPNAAIWEITIKFDEGEQLDMWADVANPFWQESPRPTNLDRPTVLPEKPNTNLDKS